MVLDHHEYEGDGYSDYAIYVDNQTSPQYENKSLAGCGVAWQCCRMMDELLGTNYAFKYIDLVALGCAADVMSPLTKENRFIFDYGFNNVQDVMFQALLNKQAYSMQNTVDYTSVAFYIAPLINACMRSGTEEEKTMMYNSFLNPMQIVESQKRGAKGERVYITEECGRVLTNVKARQQRLIDKYEDTFEGRILSEGLNDNNVLLLHLQPEDNFDAELNGLIATRFSNNYHKPCLVIRDGNDGLTKGSFRNPNGSPIEDLKGFIGSSPYTDFVAGHKSAGGTGIKTACLDKFIDWFNQQTAAYEWNENCYEVQFDLNSYDSYLSALCWDIANNNKLWGGNNPQPLIVIRDIPLTAADITIMGQKADTLKWQHQGVPCILFKSAELGKKLKAQSAPIRMTLIGRPSLNEWYGRVSVQLIVDEVEWHTESICDF